MVNPAAKFQTLPQTVAFGDNSLFPLNNDGTAFPQGRSVTQYGIVDDFSWTRGRHGLRFGVNFRRDDVSDHIFTGVIPFAQETSLNDFAFGGVAPGNASGRESRGAEFSSQHECADSALSAWLVCIRRGQGHFQLEVDAQYAI